MTAQIDDAQTQRLGSKDDPLLLLLHGYGANERDLVSLAPLLPRNLELVAVRAPIQLAPGAHAWVQPDVPEDQEPKFTKIATDVLLDWFDRHVAPGRTVVPLGFSEGGMMVTQLLRSRPTRFAAGVVLSGYVVNASLPGDDDLKKRRPPVFFGHADVDPLIEPAIHARAARWLAEHTDVDDRTYPGIAHSISRVELEDVHGFLQSALS